MNNRKGECDDQKCGHSPESIKQKGILVLIMMGRMGQISGKFPVGTLVAFGTGCHNILTAQMGIGIIDRQNIMDPVAIITFGSPFGTEPGNLPVIGIKESRRFRCVALAALFHHGYPESLGIGSADGMGGVTMLTCG